MLPTQAVHFFFHFFVPLHLFNHFLFFAGVMIFFCSSLAFTWKIDIFCSFDLILRGNLDICEGDDLFFLLHLILRGKLDISGFFLVYMSFFFQQIAIVFFIVMLIAGWTACQHLAIAAMFLRSYIVQALSRGGGPSLVTRFGVIPQV